MQKVTVLYHDDADGFGAAYALWCKYGDGANYIPVNYKEPVPQIPESTIKLFIVDFSYDYETLMELEQRYDLAVYDHHIGAKDVLNNLQCAVFDNTVSGAVLTWKMVHPGVPVPKILEYVQDRDLWKFELPHSKEVNVAIFAMPTAFEDWHDKSEDVLSLFTEGLAILRFQNMQIQSRIKHARMMVLAGYEVPVVNTADNISDIGHALCEAYPDSPFSVMYWDRYDGMRVFSLRSENGFDVSEVAKLFGGGGHAPAAGFTVPPSWIEQSGSIFNAAAEEAGL